MKLDLFGAEDQSGDDEENPDYHRGPADLNNDKATIGDLGEEIDADDQRGHLALLFVRDEAVAILACPAWTRL